MTRLCLKMPQIASQRIIISKKFPRGVGQQSTSDKSTFNLKGPRLLLQFQAIQCNAMLAFQVTKTGIFTSLLGG